MEIKLYQLLFQIINFGILLFIMVKFLYKPILKILDQRSERIDAGLLAAQQNLDDREHLEALKKAELLKAEKEAAKIIEAAKVDAQKVTTDLLAQAKHQAELIMEKEERTFKARLDAEEKHFSQRLSSLVTLTTKTVLKDALTPEQQRLIIEYQVKQLPKVLVN